MTSGQSLKYWILLFLTAFILLIFVVGGTETVFSSEKVGGWLRQGIAKLKIDPAIDIEFETAKTTWTGSLIHPLGIRINNLDVSGWGDCSKSKISFERATIPFSIRAALKGKLDLGVVKFSKGSLILDQTCERKENTSSESNEVAATPSKSDDHISKFLFELSRALQKLQFKKSSSLVKGLLFSRLNYDFGNGLGVFAHRIRVGRKSSGDLDSEWLGEFDLGAQEGKRVKVKFHGRARLTQKMLSFEFDGRRKEGVVEVRGTFPLAKEGSSVFPEANLRLSLKDFPVSTFFEARDFGLKLPVQKRRFWLDCTVDGKIHYPSKIHLYSEGCFTRGALGRVSLKNSARGIWNGEWKFEQPVELSLTDVPLHQIYPFLGTKRPDGIFGEFGIFNSHIVFETPRTGYGDFELRDFSVRVRSQGVSAFQKGKVARGSASLSANEKLEFSFEEIELEEGDFEGTISGRYDLSARQLNMDFEVPHLELSSKITQRIFGIELGPMQFHGKGSFDFPSEEFAVDFELDLDRIYSRHWRLRSGELPCKLRNKNLACNYKLESLEISKEALVASGWPKKRFVGLDGNLKFARGELEFFSKANDKMSLGAKWTFDKGLVGTLSSSADEEYQIEFRSL